MPIGTPDPGRNTATPTNLAYRVGRIAPYLSGRWLDYGCAEGGYASALLNNGATSVVGVDILEDRINSATARQLPNTAFYAFDGSRLDFPDESFDGAFVNEVLEHVADEHESLLEIQRVLRPGGLLVRRRPLAGHGFVDSRKRGFRGLSLGQSRRRERAQPCGTAVGAALLTWLVLERNIHLGAVARDVPILDGQVKLFDLGHPEVANGAGGGLDRVARGGFPGL